MSLRVVSTACSNTEILCALGAKDLLIGVDEHSDCPPNVVNRLARVGPDLGVDADRVAALKPDLVLASLTVPGHEDVVARLRQRGLRVVALEPVSLSDVYANIEEIAELVDFRSEGKDLVARMRATLKPLPPPSPRTKVLVEWWPKPVIAPGKLSWVTDLIELAGGENPLGEVDVKSQPIDEGDALREDPDAIVVSWCGVPTRKYRPNVVYRRPGWGSIRAVKRRYVFPVAEAFLGRPGPRLVEGFRALRKVVVQAAR